MTAADVVASLRRWLDVGGRMGALVAAVLEDPKNPNWVRAVDKYTIEARFAKANLSFLQGLSTIRQGAYIIPLKVAEKYGKRTDWQPQDYIGTGPYRLQRWVPGRGIRLVRYDPYQPRREAPIGYGGARVPYLDAIEFVPIPDASVRAAELEVGKTHVLVEGSVADLKRLRGNQRLELIRSTPGWYDHIYFNLRNGPFAVKEGDRALKLRQAAVAALNVEEIAKATYGDPDVYRLDPGMMWKETLWWSDACKESYNQANPQRARQLLQEAGYRGERIRFRTTKELGDVGTWSEVVAKQLRDVGFNVETQVMDYTSYVGRWFANDGWELSALILTYRDDPLLLAQLPLSDIFARPTQPVAPELYALMDRLATESDLTRRRAVVGEIQCALYRQALHIRLADVFEVRFVSKNLRGFKPTPELFLWNVWLER
jgi:peptide/nickel transport system substrate-binding protein